SCLTETCPEVLRWGKGSYLRRVLVGVAVDGKETWLSPYSINRINGPSAVHLVSSISRNRSTFMYEMQHTSSERYATVLLHASRLIVASSSSQCRACSPLRDPANWMRMGSRSHERLVSSSSSFREMVCRQER